MVTAEIRSKYKGKSIEWLEDKLQELVNAKVRRRDSANGYFICIACGELKSVKQMNASHYYPKEPKQYRAVRFNLDNIHGGCIRCNKYLSGNLLPYRVNLLAKIGAERLASLEKLASLNNFKFDRNFLIMNIEKLKTEKTN